MRALATYLLRGNKEAIIVILVCSMLALLVPIFGLFNAVIIGLVSLRLGTNTGLLLSAVSSVAIATGILAFGIMPEQSKGEEVFAIAQWVATLLALVALCGLLRYTRSLQLSMLTALGGGIAVIVGFRLFVQDTVAWWQNSPLKEVYHSTVETIMAQQPMVNHQMLEGVSASLVGLFVATFIASLFVQLYLARSWQAVMFNPGGFKEEFCSLRYGKYPVVVAIGSLLLFMVIGAETLPGYVGVATIWLMGMMYTIYGIAVMSGLFKARNWHLGMLFGGIVLVMIVTSIILQRSFSQPGIVSIIIVIFMLASIGFFDTFLDFRSKVRGNTKADDQN